MQSATALKKQSARIEELIGKLEACGDPDLLANARELVQSLMELYGAGLARIAETIQARGAAAREILEDLARDELVASLLAANGLHPLSLDVRVRDALEKLNGRFRSQGRVQLLGIDDGIIRLRLRTKAATACGSSNGEFKAAVEEAIYAAAPDLARLDIEVVEEPGAASGFVPLEKLGAPGRAVSGNGAGI